MNNKGFQLSIGMLVTIILGIAMLGLGFSLFHSAFQKTSDIRANVDSQTQARINALLDDGSIVVIPQKNLDGARGDISEFSLGITNIYPEEKDFVVFVTYGGSSAYSDPSQDPFDPFDFLNVGKFGESCGADHDMSPSTCGTDWVLIPGSQETIVGAYRFKDVQANGRESINVGIRVPKKGVLDGQYLFNIDICVDTCVATTYAPFKLTDDSRYDARHKVTVTV